MLEKVLYLVNFEPYEPELVRCLTRLHEVGYHELILAHVPKTEEVLHHIPSLLRDDLRHDLSEAAHRKLDAFARLCQAQGMAARSILKEGELAWLEIRQLAQQEDISLLVVGPTVGPRIGTTVSFLMPGARAPLLIIKVSQAVEQAPYETICQSMFGRVLYPTDGSTCALKARDYIIRLKPLGMSEVVVAHVVDPTDIEALTLPQQAEHRTQMQRHLDQTQRILDAAGLRVKTQLLEGHPGRELVSLAGREQVALIVMGSTGKSMATEMSLGSVSAYVARTTERSILLIY